LVFTWSLKMRKIITVLVIGVLLLNAGCFKQPAQTTTPDSTSPTSATISVTPVTPPSKGDWTVTKQQIVEDKTISLNGNLILKKGSSLTLRNVKLVLNCTYNGEYGISAEPGSSLFIYGCVITAADLEHHFSFTVEGSAFEMINSELHGSGWGHDDPEKMIKVPYGTLKQEFALWISTNGALIEGNVITDNSGVVALEGSKSRVVNNKLHSNTGIPILVYGGEEQIIGNQIEHSIPAGTYSPCIALYGGGDNLVDDNQLSSSPQGGSGMLSGIAVGNYASHSFNNKIINNKISNLPSTGIILGQGSEISSNNLIMDNVLSQLGECGMCVHGSSNKIDGNIIDSCQTGIDLTYSYGNVISNNDITVIGNRIPESPDKALMEPCDAIRMSHCSNNFIVNNEISDAGYSGILMWGLSNNNIVEGNRIFSSYHGIFILYSSDHNRVTGNEIVSTISESIMLDDSSQNLIFSNNFIDCGALPYDTGINTWDDGHKGNYWSTYMGKDANEDGVGDQPYGISTSSLDNYPLKQPISIQPVTVATPKPVSNPGPITETRINHSEEWKDKTIVLDSNLTINSGCTLTITNVTLHLGSEEHAVMVFIESGGGLIIDNSTINDTERGYGCMFMAGKGSAFTMRDSRWQGMICMWWDEGFFIFADNVTIENCFFKRVNIKLIGTSGARIVNNTIEDTISPISLYGSSNCVLDNNVIRNCVGTAIGLNGSYGRGSESGSNNNSVQNNLVSNSWSYGIIVGAGSGNIVNRNQIENVTSMPLLVVEDNNVVKDNIIK
jgi:parallel beta-helix repeat protein